MKITIEVEIDASLAQVWRAWTTPEDIICWNFASEQWCCPSAKINLAVGKPFSYRMEAKDKSMGFDFCGEFTEVRYQQLIRFKLEDGRETTVEFLPFEQGVKLVETFDAENEHSAEQQREGWLSILENFKKHVEQSV